MDRRMWMGVQQTPDFWTLEPLRFELWLLFLCLPLNVMNLTCHFCCKLHSTKSSKWKLFTFLKARYMIWRKWEIKAHNQSCASTLIASNPKQLPLNHSLPTAAPPNDPAHAIAHEQKCTLSSIMHCYHLLDAKGVQSYNMGWKSQKTLILLYGTSD